MRFSQKSKKNFSQSPCNSGKYKRNHLYLCFDNRKFFSVLSMYVVKLSYMVGKYAIESVDVYNL